MSILDALLGRQKSLEDVWRDKNAEKIMRSGGAYHYPTIRDAAEAGFTDLFSYNNPANQARDLAKQITGTSELMTPLGVLTSAQDTQQKFKGGNYLGAGLAAIGAVPGVGGEERAASKVADAVAPAAEKIVAPAVHTKGAQSAAEKIFQHAETELTPKYTPAKEPVFNTSGDVEGMTKALVPQKSIADKLPQVPTREFLKTRESGNRSLQILDNAEAIGQRMARDVSALPNQGRLPFYSTGPVLQGLMDRAGLSYDDALSFMHDWSGQGAATSPRTKTPPNLRNASYLQYQRAEGQPITTAVRQAQGNRPGFPMMDMHTDLADQFARGTADPLKNSKPFTFQQNWMGNMADVTADTHNIRKILDTYDQLFPGTLDRSWFTNPEAHARYQANKGFQQGGLMDEGLGKKAIADGLETFTNRGQKTQYEYPIIQRPTEIAAQQLGISPAEAQERLWFQGGPRTNLRSPPMTIPELFNAQIEKTAKVLGMSPDQVLKLWGRRGIPLAQNEPAGQGTSPAASQFA